MLKNLKESGLLKYPLLFACEIRIEPFFSKLTGWAISASISDYSIITGEGLIADDIESTQFVSQCPGFFFVQPHQWSDDIKREIHGERQGGVQRFDKNISAIRISGKITLGYAGDDVCDATLFSENSSIR